MIGQDRDIGVDIKRKLSKLTSLLQKHRLPIKDPTLMPRHPIPELIDPDLPLSVRPPHPRDRDLQPIHRADRDHHGGGAAAATPPSAAARVRLRIGIVTIIISIALEEPRAMRGGRGVLHLHGEPGAREDGAGFAEGVRDLVCVDGVEGGADADAVLVARGLVDDDELWLLRVGDVGEEGEAVVIAGGF